MENLAKALMVEVGKAPKVVEVRVELSELQKAVRGYIETIHAFEDNACIICNEEGRLIGMEPNRSLTDEAGRVTEVVVGPFLVIGVGEEDFCSLTPEQMKRYEKRFHNPEAFLQTEDGIVVISIKEMEADDDSGEELH